MDLTHPHRAACAALCTLFALLIAASASAAEDEPAEADDEAPDDEAIEVPVVVEAAEIEVQPGHVRYDAETISAMPGGEANLADLLRVNPAVDFSRDAELSASTAVQRPAEIAIHGQPIYQNAFLIDGIDTANDLNPADTDDLWSSPSLVAPHRGSSVQGYYVDTTLLDSVEVYDSNIPAEYGGFTGGVVAAEVKRYDSVDSLSISYSLRRDEWEEFHVTGDDLVGGDYYHARYTPDYRRSHLTLGAQRGIGGLGLSLSVSRRQSTFSQHYVNQQDRQVFLDYDDVIDNVVGSVDWDVGPTTVGVSMRHARRRHDGLTAPNYTGLFEKSHAGNGVTLNIERPVRPGQLEIAIGLDRVRDTLESETNRLSSHASARSSQTEFQFEGAYGDSDQSQTRFSVKPKLVLAPRSTGRLQHRIVLGGELVRTESYYERPEDVVFENYRCVRGRGPCVDQNGDGVSGWEDEYLFIKSIWYAGKVELGYASVALHAEDRIEIGMYRVNLGARVDWNDYLGNVDLSPRFSVERDLFGNDRTIVIAGLNRYYGRSFFRYHLNDAIAGWRDITQFNSDGSVRRVLTFDDRSGDSDLATPYSDEWMVGVTQALGRASARLQFVNRESRDGVTRERYCLDPEDTRCREYNYIYVNKGRSSTQTVGLGLSSADPLRLGATETTFAVSLGYKDSTSNRQSMQGYDEQIEEDLIYYDGGLVHVVDLPAWDHNIPFTTSFYTVTSFPDWNLTWSNFAKLRRGGTIARDSGLDCDDDEVDYCEGSYDIYEDFDFDSLWTLDARVEWRPDLIADSQGYLRLEIKNLLDQVVDTNSARLSDRRRFTSGRLFWVELGLDI